MKLDHIFAVPSGVQTWWGKIEPWMIITLLLTRKFGAVSHQCVMLSLSVLRQRLLWPSGVSSSGP